MIFFLMICKVGVQSIQVNNN